KERIFSFRDDFGQWNPRAQRPELWNVYNARVRKGEHVRVFPISNWTELDVWQYVGRERLELPLIYFSHEREVFRRDGMLYACSSYVERLPEEEPFTASVRFRTVGDMTCTGGVVSGAATIAAVVDEIAATRVTERGETRADDRFTEAAMEDRKRVGYFYGIPGHRAAAARDGRFRRRRQVDADRPLALRHEADPRRPARAHRGRLASPRARLRRPRS